MPSQEALEIDAALKHLRAVRGTSREADAVRGLEAVVAAVKARRKMP